MGIKPSYVIFSNNDYNYLYDRYSNHLLRIDEDFKEAINSNCNDSRLTELQEKYGILKCFDVPKMSLSPTTDDDEKISRKVAHSIHRLTFITTEECNLRCKYCLYSGSYSEARHHNSHNAISFDIAKKAIDLFMSISDSASDRTISFYGGESLLEFDLVKKAVVYARTLCDNFHFSIVTNLVLLTDEKRDFFISNNFNITVSIDGPREIHDLFRVTKSQAPTHSVIERNLWSIRMANEDYFKNYVSFNTVLVPHSQRMSLLDEYFSGPLFEGVPIDSFHVFTLNPKDNSFMEQNHYSDYLDGFYKYSKDLFVRKHIHKQYDFDNWRITFNFHIRQMKRIFFKSEEKLENYSFFWPNSICILGMKTLLITAAGTIYPCETLYDEHELSIGHLDTGLDVQNISSITKEYIEKSVALCKSCWAYRFCPQCFIAAYKYGTYDQNLRAKECLATKKEIIKDFQLYLSILEEEPSAFNYLKKLGRDEIFSDMIED